MNQDVLTISLEGRSGRQGDPGFSRFYVSFEDELMVRFGSENIQKLFGMMGEEAIENKMVTKAIATAQKRVEGSNFDTRKTLLDYDDVLRQQRETIYAQRNFMLRKRRCAYYCQKICIKSVWKQLI